MKTLSFWATTIAATLKRAAASLGHRHPVLAGMLMPLAFIVIAPIFGLVVLACGMGVGVILAASLSIPAYMGIGIIWIMGAVTFITCHRTNEMILSPSPAPARARSRRRR